MSRAPMFVLFGSMLCAGCGSSDPSPTERLWISGLPKSAKAPVSAFVTTRTGEGKYIGAFFQGSALRGSHDVFEWRADGKDAAKLTFLQDRTTRRIRFETCKATLGFDMCLIVRGDGGSEQRYYSRKRWNVRRPGKKQELGAVMVPELIGELAEDDDELQAALELPLEPVSP
ncbi:MAG: hypothetical protein IAG13_09245 [Deltaproteobacteria bacterium]|nr:hypothetical protein [Nannocystaceae bacterium]